MTGWREGDNTDKRDRRRTEELEEVKYRELSNILDL